LYSNHPEINNITVDDLGNLFFSTRPKDRDFYVELFDNLKRIEVSNISVIELCKSLQKSKLYRELALSAYDAAEGKQEQETKTLQLWEQLSVLNSKQDSDTNDEFNFVSDDIENLVSVVRTPGLRWRLHSLNRSLGSLRKGNFGFIFARPETGKTTFLASEASFMAEQESCTGPIIHLNNEQVGEEVMLRYYQAALGCTMEQLYSNLGKAREHFKHKTKGKIMLFDQGQIHRKHVEKLCEKYKPSLVIYDQIDKITGFDSDREDLRLGSIYQWARELAKSYCPSIGVCQADGSGEGQRWLTMGNVANAKTSKQAEADWILGIGKSNDPGYERLRFFHLSKNKLIGDPDTEPPMRHGKWETLIEAEVARYRDL
jgi:hypothetical protein